MKCPICGGEMDRTNVNFGSQSLPVLRFWYCNPECGYWIPCNRDGKVPEDTND